MDDLLREVIDIFVAEVREQADRIAQGLLLMEQQPERIPSEIEEVYRQAHSLKGSSASLGVEELSQLAHHFESALLPVRRRQTNLTHEDVDLGLRAMDAAKLRVVGLQADSDVGLAEVRALAHMLETLAQQRQGVSTLVPQKTLPEETDPSNPLVKEDALPGQPSSADAPLSTPPPTEPDRAVVAEPLAAQVDASDTVRVQVEKVHRLLKHTDELRRLRGQLERHLGEVALLLRGSEKLKRQQQGHTDEAQRQHNEDLSHIVRGLRALRRDLLDDVETLQATTTEIDDGLRAMQLMPASLLKQPLHRASREASRATGKEVHLRIDGEDVFLDRALLEAIRSPLVHLVRNAVDHGIEPVAVREAIGKPAEGRVTVSFAQHGSLIEITVSDDGRGLDGARIREVAVERGVLTLAQAETLDEEGTYELLLRPDFSTREEITELSGRGVGLDVVNTAVQKLHGSLQVHSQPGQGCSFVVTAPLTVAASRLLLLEEQDHTFALPLQAVSRIVLPRRQDLVPLAGQTVCDIDGQPHTVVSLSQLLGQTHSSDAHARQPLLLLRGSSGIVIACDKLRGENDLVLRPLPVELRQLKLLSAVAIVPSGPVLFVLSPQALMQAAMHLRFLQDVRTRRKTVLVADDSITTRSLLRSVLESGGYRVRTAADGDEALRIARSEPIDLLVSDVRMPRLDGIGLLSRLKADSRTNRLPVVLFSGAKTDDDRERGLAAGASAYLAKSDFERGQLIDVVTHLLAGAS